MTAEVFIIGIVAVVALLVLVLIGVPISMACAAIGLTGLWITAGTRVVMTSAFQIPFFSITKYVLVVLPLFILMGHFAGAGGYVNDFFNAARKWFGSMRGALALATMMTCAALGAVSGSTVAAAALMGKVAVPEMLKSGYDKSLSAGCVAMGGTLAALIPPSLGLVFYATIAEVSIGKLLIAGIGPGILTAIVWMLTIYILGRTKESLFPSTAVSYPLREKIAEVRNTWPIFFLVIIVLGGLYVGFFTATEAAAVGVMSTLLLLFMKKRFSGQVVKEGLLGVARTSGAIFIIIASVHIYSVFLARTGFTVELANWFASLEVSRYVLISGFMFLYLILGTFMDALGMMAITIPLWLPVVVSLGFDPIWWGIMVQKGMEIGLATPPFGLNVFTVKSVAPDIEMGDIFRGTIPFLIAEIPILVLLVAFPQIALFLPQKMTAG